MPQRSNPGHPIKPRERTPHSTYEEERERRDEPDLHWEISKMAASHELNLTAECIADIAEWYTAQRTGRTLKDSTPTNSLTPNPLNYREDIFDGVLCRWEYKQPYRGAPHKIENLLCYCQHCDFIIGTPNHHEQRCSSCSRRPVKCGNTPFYSDNIFQNEISGVQEAPKPNVVREIHTLGDRHP